MKFRRENDEVLYLERPGRPVGQKELDELVRLAAANPRKRVRLCTHAGPESALHEMFIVHGRECYVRPHKHLHKDECITVHRGRVDVVLFDDAGRANSLIELGDATTGFPFSCRLVAGVYHMFIIRSEALVFCEATTGPFAREEMALAAWSPDEGGDVAKFQASVEKQLERL